MSCDKWREAFPRGKRPAYDELLAFWPEHIRALFLAFNAEMNNAYSVYNKWHRFEKNAGWVYGYCRNYRCELLSVSVGDDCFYVLGETVSDANSLCSALAKVKEKYDSGYEAHYSKVVAEKKANQIERTKLRVAQEKEQMAALMAGVDSERLNRFKWVSKVSRSKLVRLYQGEAKGLLDVELLDDVGITFYSRCKQAIETRECLDRGQLICHFCGAVLTPGSYTAAVTCPCGYSYTYREYRRSCNAANVPGGRAMPVFHAFVAKWPQCKDSTKKMLLLDWLVHECHVTVMSGAKGRSVCVNLIEGTLAQLRDMLEKLAGH